MAFVRSDCHAKVHDALSSMIYECWDESQESGAKTRPADDESSSGPLGLKVLAVDSNNCIVWPESVLKRFPAHTPEYETIHKMQKEFLEKFPQTAPRPASASKPDALPTRAIGSPDFTIDGGAEPLDPTRSIDLEGVQSHDFLATKHFGLSTVTTLMVGCGPCSLCLSNSNHSSRQHAVVKLFVLGPEIKLMSLPQTAASKAGMLVASKAGAGAGKGSQALCCSD